MVKWIGFVLCLTIMIGVSSPSAAQGGPWCLKYDFTAANNNIWVVLQGNYVQGQGYRTSVGDFIVQIYQYSQGGVNYNEAAIVVKNRGGDQTIRMQSSLWDAAQDRTYFIVGNGTATISRTRQGAPTETGIIAIDADYYVDIQQIFLRGNGTAPTLPGAINCVESATPSPTSPVVDVIIPILASPTPIPTGTPAPTRDPASYSDIYKFVATAAANVNAIPNDITAPGGVNLLVDENAQQIFGYTRWLFSDIGARELLGPTLFAIALSVFFIITATFIVMPIRALIDFAVSIVAFVKTAIAWVLKFIPFLGMFVQGVYPPTPTPFGQGVPAPISAWGDSMLIPDQYDIWYFAPDAISWWNRIGPGNTSAVQVAALLMLIIAALFLIYKRVRSFNNLGGEREL